jgi:hypothetical protein
MGLTWVCSTPLSTEMSRILLHPADFMAWIMARRVVVVEEWIGSGVGELPGGRGPFLRGHDGALLRKLGRPNGRSS